uniref:Uncharacterized protein n=1 Tax=viral metagenome TaxID=1070528 RepID=A0A6M3XSM2_9ZZZZ
MSTWVVTVGREERLRYRASWASASSPIEIIDGDEVRATPFQVADAYHAPVRVPALLWGWLDSEGGAPWAEDEKIGIAPLTLWCAICASEGINARGTVEIPHDPVRDGLPVRVVYACAECAVQRE